MSEFVVAVLAFLGGVVVGIIGMFFSDSRYLKKIQEIYDTREKRYEATIKTQKDTIDNLLLANNRYQAERASRKA